MCDRKNIVRTFSGEWNAPKLIKEATKTIDTSFYLCNLSDIKRKFTDWCEKIPRVKPFYAVSAACYNIRQTNSRKVLSGQVQRWRWSSPDSGSSWLFVWLCVCGRNWKNNLLWCSSEPNHIRQHDEAQKPHSTGEERKCQPDDVRQRRWAVQDLEIPSDVRVSSKNRILGHDL